MMRYIRKFGCIILTLALLLAMIFADGSLRAEAASGKWKHNSNGYYYVYANGTRSKKGWKKIDGKKYYFNAKGYRVTGKKKINGVTYSFDQNGVLKKIHVKKGSTIKLGSCEQDNKKANGKEVIEWIVLDKQAGGKLLLVSKYALDCKPFNSSSTSSGNWKTSTVRKWLNGSFYKNAFKANEKNMIQKVSLKNSEYLSSKVYTTKDRLFLLDLKEVKKYYAADKSRTTGYNIPYYSKKLSCKPTKYARAKGAIPTWAKGETYCQWILRTTLGDDVLFAKEDSVHYDMNPSSLAEAIRPAMWINLTAE